MPTTGQTLQQAQHGLTAINQAINIGLTTAIIGPLTTTAGLQSAITTLGAASSSAGITAARVNRVIDYLVNAAILTNTNVAAADTVAGIRAIFTTIDSSLSAYHSASILGN